VHTREEERRRKREKEERERNTPPFLEINQN